MKRELLHGTFIEEKGLIRSQAQAYGSQKASNSKIGPQIIKKKKNV